MTIIMKKYIYSAFIAALMISASCAKEQAPVENATDKVTITASFPEELASKVAMDETSTGLELKWKDTDYLTVVGNTTETYKVVSISSNGKTATFAGTPVEGESFKVILSSLGEDYNSRSYSRASQPDNEGDMNANLEYDAVLENVKDYTSVSFTEAWAEANGATLSQTGCMMLWIQVPDECANVRYVKFSVDGNLLSDTNAGTNKGCGREIHFVADQTPSDGLLKAYLITPMNEDVIPAGTVLSVMLETNEAPHFYKEYTFTQEYRITPGKRNVVKLNKEGWEKRATQVKTNGQNTPFGWIAPYSNIFHKPSGPGKLIDGNGSLNTTSANSLWQYPYDGRTNYLGIDPSFDEWTYDGNTSSYAYDCAPFIAIINLKETQVLQQVIIKPEARNHQAGYTSTGEVWVSTDTSNDTADKAHPNQAKTNVEHLTAKNLVTSNNSDFQYYWPFWKAKKWVKVCDFDTEGKCLSETPDSEGFKFNVNAVPARYIKIVLHEGNPIDGVPVLALSELELKYYPKYE